MSAAAIAYGRRAAARTYGRRDAALGFGRGADVFLQRHLSSKVGQTNLIDSLATVKRSSEQAKNITGIVEALNSLKNFTQSQVQRSKMIQDSNILALKSEVKRFQEQQLALVQQVQQEMEKLRSEQRLLLAMGEIIDKLQKIHVLSGRLAAKKAIKSDIIKCCLGTVISISAVGLVVRFLI